MIFSPDIQNAAQDKTRSAERGNILFMILIAVVLIGLLTAAIMSTSTTDGANIDKETLVIRASEVQRTASEYERAVLFIVSNRKSETDIRFAHPAADAAYGNLTDADTLEEQQVQVFHANGGGASYREPPEDIQTATGGKWEFYGGTAIPGVGTSRPDLIAVLPNVTQQFCNKINDLNGQPVTPTPEDTGSSAAGVGVTGDCLNIGPLGRFNGTQQFYTLPNTMDETTFAQDPNTSAARPALQACVQCDIGPALHFYHVLLAR
ncbi:MAG: hypothetical protein DYH13_09775 [Alphaproteobacteria bacterium PRO2]|nr:hypothetical protein [Alphaproteobacteria bacterium PRO2]